MSNYSLTPMQEKAFRRLQKAFDDCEKSGIYLWDNYGTIEAVNGFIIGVVAPDDSLDEPLDESLVQSITTKCWNGSNADDLLWVRYKDKNEAWE